MSWWVYRFTLARNTAVLIISLYQKLSTPQNLPYLKQSSVKCVDEIVDCYPQTDASDGIEQPASIFLVLCSILCPQWSAFGKPWSVTAETMQQRLPFFVLFCFLTFLLNQEHGVHNEGSKSIQSVRHSKLTCRMWHHQKDRSARKKQKQQQKFFSCIAHSWQSCTGPRLKVWYCHRPALFDCRLHSEIVDLYISLPVYKVRVWNGVVSSEPQQQW